MPAVAEDIIPGGEDYRFCHSGILDGFLSREPARKFLGKLAKTVSTRSVQMTGRRTVGSTTSLTSSWPRTWKKTLPGTRRQLKTATFKSRL